MTAKALGIAAILGVFFCGLGSLVLEKRLMRGPRVGIWATLGARVRRYAGTLRGKWMFRPLLTLLHPLVRRECAVDRDLAFRVSWIVLAGIYAAAVRITLGWPWSDGEYQFILAGSGVGVGALLAVLLGALSVGYDRRRGALQTLLASGVSPEDLVRARLAGLVLRAFSLLLIPAIHLILIGAYMGHFSKWELAWRIPATIVSLILGATAMMLVTLRTALSQRRPEVAAVLAIVAVPAGIGIAVLVAAFLPTFAIQVPLVILSLTNVYTRIVSQVPKWVLR